MQGKQDNEAVNPHTGDLENDDDYSNFINNDIAFREDDSIEKKNQGERNLIDYKHSMQSIKRQHKGTTMNE